MIEKKQGPTPRGGAYAIVAWLDADGRDVEHAEATVALVSEYTVDDRWLFETVLVLGREEL